MRKSATILKFSVARVYRNDGMLTGVALGQSLQPLPDASLDTLEVDLEKELSETGAYFPMRFVWGRKPHWLWDTRGDLLEHGGLRDLACGP